MELSNSTVKTPEPETEAPTPTRIQLPPPGSAGNKHSPFTNGVLKRHAPPLHLHPPVVVTYRECLKNHAAALGGHAVDGCGEFMPSPASNPADPTSLCCAACGCHRNFHRRDPEETSPLLLPAPPQPAIEYRPHHRHHPPPPGGPASPDDSPSPPPISSAYYPPSAPHMLLALSHGLANPPPPHDGGAGGIFSPTPLSNSGSGRKRFRTKFTHNQKEKMLELAERVGWKMQRKDEELLNGVCAQIGVEKGVFKVWMHNNKNNFGKKGGGVDLPAQFANAARIANNNNNPPPPPTAAAPANGAAADYHHHHRPALEDEEDLEDEDHIDSKQNVHHHVHDHHHHHLINSARILGTTNGSSSSS